ncbi:MAG: DUF3347 domain-containing protein [Myxococcales bacterium]|nr:DUF3347 domain-containing protein [Myxococcales bacterium]MCA9696925.1 DUF3347 domain-containing protein [Myxococcales bacterium]
MAELSRRAWHRALAGLAVIAACKPQAEVGDGTILTPYLRIGAVLADDSIDDIARLGAVLIEAAQSQEGQAGIDEILAAAGRLASPDIATVRLAYRKMSEGMIAWLAAHAGERGELQLIYCPMAFNNQGAYWVQRQGETANPYEGAMMLRCGAKIGWDEHRPGAPPAGDTVVEGMQEE